MHGAEQIDTILKEESALCVSITRYVCLIWVHVHETIPFIVFRTCGVRQYTTRHHHDTQQPDHLSLIVPRHHHHRPHPAAILLSSSFSVCLSVTLCVTHPRMTTQLIKTNTNLAHIYYIMCVNPQVCYTIQRRKSLVQDYHIMSCGPLLTRVTNNTKRVWRQCTCVCVCGVCARGGEELFMWRPPDRQTCIGCYANVRNGLGGGVWGWAGEMHKQALLGKALGLAGVWGSKRCVPWAIYAVLKLIPINCGWEYSPIHMEKHECWIHPIYVHVVPTTEPLS